MIITNLIIFYIFLKKIINYIKLINYILFLIIINKFIILYIKILLYLLHHSQIFINFPFKSYHLSFNPNNQTFLLNPLSNPNKL